MTDHFLQLPPEQRAEILNTLGTKLGREPLVLEKDVWVCWTLAALFSFEGALPMAFKGDTSLSKVFNAIHRFSEDLDVTIAYAFLDSSVDPFDPALSASKRTAFSEVLRTKVTAHVRDSIAPHLSQVLSADAGSGPSSVAFDGIETVEVRYPSALGPAAGYLSQAVKIEFGGRNSIVPHQVHEVTPDIAGELPGLRFPVARPKVLSAARTFWEKATLIHVECNKGGSAAGVERRSRHWYDLVSLARGSIGQAALADRELLRDVVRHKKVFYRSAKADYDACTTGKLRLLPTGDLRAALERDYKAMIDAGMFYAEPPPFAELLDELTALQTKINTRAQDA